jgi:hypothetical protein
LTSMSFSTSRRVSFSASNLPAARCSSLIGNSALARFPLSKCCAQQPSDLQEL